MFVVMCEQVLKVTACSVSKYLASCEANACGFIKAVCSLKRSVLTGRFCINITWFVGS